MTERRRPTPRAVLGTVALLAAVLVCVRLGFWQLDRLQQRRALNARVAERMAAPALEGAGALADTARSLYRRVALTGQYDDARSIILPGRSLRGTPGVHLLTPLRIRSDEAVLINRGWVPAADGATIPVDSFPAAPAGPAEVRLTGLAVPLPVSDRPAGTGAGEFRQVWYRVNFQALQAQFPYHLLPVQLQLLPSPGTPPYPARLDPPALDAGPHLSYAIQWFSFAAIGVIGWLALVRRSRRSGQSAEPVADPAPGAHPGGKA